MSGSGDGEEIIGLLFKHSFIHSFEWVFVLLICFFLPLVEILWSVLQCCQTISTWHGKARCVICLLLIIIVFRLFFCSFSSCNFSLCNLFVTCLQGFHFDSQIGELCHTTNLLISFSPWKYLQSELCHVVCGLSWVDWVEFLCRVLMSGLDKEMAFWALECVRCQWHPYKERTKAAHLTQLAAGKRERKKSGKSGHEMCVLTGEAESFFCQPRGWSCARPHFERQRGQGDVIYVPASGSAGLGLSVMYPCKFRIIKSKSLTKSQGIFLSPIQLRAHMSRMLHCHWSLNVDFVSAISQLTKATKIDRPDKRLITLSSLFFSLSFSVRLPLSHHSWVDAGEEKEGPEVTVRSDLDEKKVEKSRFDLPQPPSQWATSLFAKRHSKGPNKRGKKEPRLLQLHFDSSFPL